MAFSINGFGTTYYGERDLSRDGSFITTEWITAAYLPLLPLRSLRVSRSAPFFVLLWLRSKKQNRHAPPEPSTPPPFPD